jgi:DNA end-binding protein Ku
MTRVLWKGAITFGLVNIPVNLYPGSRSSTLDLDLLDKRDFSLVGYRRVNKRTGEAVSREDLVKGYEHAKAQYVVVTYEDCKQANVKATQTVDIQAFVEAAKIAPYYYDSPYYLEPGKRGEKVMRSCARRCDGQRASRSITRTPYRDDLLARLEQKVERGSRTK